MAYLKKINKVYYLRWKVSGDDGQKSLAKSLKTRHKDIATKMLVQLERMQSMGLVDFNAPDFCPVKALRKDVVTSTTVEKVRSLRDEADRFYLAKENAWSATTQKTYKNVLEYWIKMSGAAATPISDIRESHFNVVIDRHDISATTKHFYYRHLKSFWMYLKAKGIATHDPITPLRKSLPAKRENVRPKMITEEEFKLLVQTYYMVIDKSQTDYRYDGRLVQEWFVPLMAVYFYAGLRKSEAAWTPGLEYSGLKFRNLIFEDGQLSYIALPPTKGRTERIIPVSAELASYLNPYLSIRGIGKPDEIVFINSRGPEIGQPVQSHRAAKLFKTFLKLAGLPDTRTIHGMRHRAVTTWIEQGFHTAEAKIMAGHSTQAITESYTHLTAKKLKAKMDGMNTSLQKKL
jgi:integrase